MQASKGHEQRHSHWMPPPIEERARPDGAQSIISDAANNPEGYQKRVVYIGKTGISRRFRRGTAPPRRECGGPL